MNLTFQDFEGYLGLCTIVAALAALPSLHRIESRIVYRQIAGLIFPRHSGVAAPEPPVVFFDALYGVRPGRFGIPWPSFRVSALASTIIGCAVFAVWLRHYSDPNAVHIVGIRTHEVEIFPWISEYVIKFSDRNYLYIDTLIVTFLLFNVPLDFLSLSKSRLIYISRKPLTAISAIRLIFLDIILTVTIISAAVFLCALVYYYIGAGAVYEDYFIGPVCKSGHPPPDFPPPLFDPATYCGTPFGLYLYLGEVYLTSGPMFLFGDVHPIVSFSSIFFFSTFMTSILSLFFLLIVVSARASAVYGPIAHWSRKNLDLENQARAIVNAAAILFASILYWPAAYVFDLGW